jgi:hypothetical protein
MSDKVRLTISIALFAALFFGTFPSVTPQSSSRAVRPGARSADLNPKTGSETIPIYVSAEADTYVVAEYTFDAPMGGPDLQGWRSVDATAQLDTFWHVDNFKVPAGGGNQAMWCGAPSDTAGFLCGYACLPGYGNGWDQILETPEGFATQGDVALSYMAGWDTEPGYDYVYVQYLDKNGEWNDLAVLDGVSPGLPRDHVIPESELDGFVKLRFRFVSDVIWSDEDCLYDSDGAIQIDNIQVADSTGVLHFEDFEIERLGAIASDDGVWVARPSPGFGDHADLFLISDVLGGPACVPNSHAWAFVKGPPGPGYHRCRSDTLIVPYRRLYDGELLYIANEVWSPVFDLTHDQNGQPVAPDASATVIQFSVYRDLDLMNDWVAYSWHIRSFTPETACLEAPWYEQYPIYWGDERDWFSHTVDITDMLLPGSDRAQISLGVYDMLLMCGHPECVFACHTQSPIFDNVRVLRIAPKGPMWIVYSVDMFQDNFPADGSLTGTVRMDPGRDNSPSQVLEITPADSALVKVWEPTYGLATEPATGTPAVYVHVRSSSGHAGPTVLGDNTTYLTDDGEWTTGVCAHLTGGSGIEPETFACDLNDNLFLPGDSISFYFSATDANGVTDYFSLESGVVFSQLEARTKSDEVQCLPTGRSDILFVNSAYPTDVRTPFANAFRWLGVNPDRFDVREPVNIQGGWVGVTYGLGGSATVGQIKNVYRTIVWNSGGYERYTIPESSKNRDEKLIHAYLDSTSAFDPGLYISGDNIARNFMQQRLGPPVGAIINRLGIWFANYDYDHTLLGEPLSPYVYEVPGGIFDDDGNPDVFIVSNHYCRQLGLFDVMIPAWGGVSEILYSNNPSHNASISNATTNAMGRMVRCVTDGFSFERIVDDDIGDVPDRVDHLKDILEFLRDESFTPTTVRSPVSYSNALEQNYPNPFNPNTTIRYSIARQGHVSLKVFDAKGRLVRILVDDVQRPTPECYQVEWDGTNQSGNPVATGIYFYRLKASGFVSTKKMLLIK